MGQLLPIWGWITLAIGLLALAFAFRRRCWNWLCAWNEVLTIPAAFALWAASGPLLRLADPGAGTFDAGIFQMLLFAAIGLLALHGFVRVFMKLQWPTLDGYLDHGFNKDFHSPTVTTWQRLKLSCSVFFALLLSLLLLTRVL